MERLDFGIPVVVEGKYDQMKLAEVYAGPIVRTDGFAIFRRNETDALLRRLGGERGLIVLTDPDGAGTVIRRHLSSVLPPERIYHLYVPRVAGKERRKRTPSREGVLGVEGMPAEVLRDLLLRFAAANGLADGAGGRRAGGITKADFYEWGLTGRRGAAEARDRFAERLQLPSGMTPGALLTAANLLTDRETAEALALGEEGGAHDVR